MKHHDPRDRGGLSFMAVMQEAFGASGDIQSAESIDDASDESDDAEHDGERREAFSAFVSGKGEKQQYGNERDKDHVTRHPF
jgi:hypothetical protein